MLMRMATALATVVLTLSLGATAEAGTTTNLIAANKLAANRLAANRIVTNRIVGNRLAANRVVANGVSPAIPAGQGAVADIVGIELPDGTKLTR
jgi:hypothetical protein